MLRIFATLRSMEPIVGQKVLYIGKRFFRLIVSGK